MIEIEGNIWDYFSIDSWVVVTTNGTVKHNNRFRRPQLVMGAGIAKQAKIYFPGVDYKLGKLVSHGGLSIEFLEQEHLVAFPTKHNWYDATSDIKLIEGGLKVLANHTGIFYLPRLGCGNGKLSWEDEVKPLMKQYLVSDRFRVVTPRREP